MAETEKPHSYINNSGQLIVSYHNNGIFCTIAYTGQDTIDLLKMLREKEKFIRRKVQEHAPEERA